MNQKNSQATLGDLNVQEQTQHQSYVQVPAQTQNIEQQMQMKPRQSNISSNRADQAQNPNSSLLQEYKKYSNNFFTRSSVGGNGVQTITPVLSQMPSQNPFQQQIFTGSGFEHPRILQQSKNKNRVSEPHLGQRNENVEMRNSSGHETMPRAPIPQQMSTVDHSNQQMTHQQPSMHFNTGSADMSNTCFQQQQFIYNPGQQQPHQQQMSLSLLNKTSSFLSAATANGNVSSKNSSKQTQNFQNNNALLSNNFVNSATNNRGGPSTYMSQSSHREFDGRDISNLQQMPIDSQNPQNMKKGQVMMNGQNCRIPQPSIINSATGMGNISGVRGCSNSDQENLGYQSQVAQSIVVGSKHDKRLQQTDMSLHNPMIIDKKFSNPVQKTISTSKNSNPTSHRYVAKEPLRGSGNGSKSGGHLQKGTVIRKASAGETQTQIQNNMFKRMRQTGASSSQTGVPSRYSVHQNQTIRNIQIDKRLNELKNTQNSISINQNASFVVNKYANMHQAAHESNKQSGGLVSQTVNKSGQNLNGNYPRTFQNKSNQNANLNTQRNVGQQSYGDTNGQVKGSTTGRSINKQSNGKSASHISSMTAKIINDHHERQQDKENRQKLSNKSNLVNSQKTVDSVQNSKRNKTSESTSLRQNIVPQMTKVTSVTSSTMQTQLQNMSSEQSRKHESQKKHQHSKNSGEEQCSSRGASLRNSSSRHNTNKSTKNGSSSGATGPKSSVNRQSAGSQYLMKKKSEKDILSTQLMPQQDVRQFLQQPIEEQMIVDQEVNSKQVTGLQDLIQQTQLVDVPSTNPYPITQVPQPLQQSQPMVYKKPQFDENVLAQIVQVMDQRRKDWLRQYKTQLDLNDVLEIRNPQAVIEFVPEIMNNLRAEECQHMYPSNFLIDRSFQSEISDKYRQYLVDWLAELHYKFKMWPETLYVTVGIIDKTLMKWGNFKKADLQCLGITALHIAGKYEEIYPQELKTILQVIDNAVTRKQVCALETKILECLDFDMVWPSILRFMQRYAFIANFNKEQEMVAQMFCDFTLLSMPLLKRKPSLLGAVAIYSTNKILDKRQPWNSDMEKCTGGIKEADLKPLANELFYFIKKLEGSTLKTIFRKYECKSYLEVVKVIEKIEMPRSNTQIQNDLPQDQ